MSDRSPAAKVLTIMMTDIVGSTALRRARGDRDADDILGLQASDRAAIRSRRSVAACASPWVMGSSSPFRPLWQRSAPPPPSSVRCTSTTPPTRSALSRSASASTSAQVTERDGDLLGQAVHAAARVMAEAVGGQILMTDDVRKHAEPQLDWSFLDSGLFWLRGFPERWRLYEVSWNDTSAGARPTAGPARLTPFVERDAERASLRRLVDDALAGTRQARVGRR